MESDFIFKETPVGLLKIGMENSEIISCRWVREGESIIFNKNNFRPFPEEFRKIGKEIDDYFQGDLKSFSVSLNPSGTAFEMMVWQELLKIPYGKTATYGEIAQRIGNKKSMRAVGLACKRNPIGILIPCHRVVGAGGNSGGYNGGLEKKLFLLDLENKNTGLFLYSRD